MDSRIIKSRIRVLCLNPVVFYLHKIMDSATQNWGQRLFWLFKMEDCASYGDSPFPISFLFLLLSFTCYVFFLSFAFLPLLYIIMFFRIMNLTIAMLRMCSIGISIGS